MDADNNNDRIGAYGMQHLSEVLKVNSTLQRFFLNGT
jgi:hypothetical protein